jgi:hypothetical protein
MSKSKGTIPRFTISTIGTQKTPERSLACKGERAFQSIGYDAGKCSQSTPDPLNLNEYVPKTGVFESALQFFEFP